MYVPAMKSYILPATNRNGTSHQRYIGTMIGRGVVMKPAESIMYLRGGMGAGGVEAGAWRGEEGTLSETGTEC
jgi:hypothetical protein